MKKAQLTVGLLAVFATSWDLVIQLSIPLDLEQIGLLIANIVLLLLLSFVLIALLEWVDVFDLKTNAVLTLIVLVTFRLLSAITSTLTIS